MKINLSEGGGGGVLQNLSSVTNDSFCYTLLKSFLLIGYQQICHWFLSFIIEKKALWNGSQLFGLKKSAYQEIKQKYKS